MAKCGKSCADACCKVKTKRKAAARRPPRPPVYRGVSANVLGGSEQMYVNNLMSYLQNLNRPQVAQTAGLAVPVRPVMVSTGTDARPLMVSDGIQATIATRTSGAQARAATTETGTGMDARATAETGTGMDAAAGRGYGTQTYGTQVLRRPRPATATTGTGMDAMPTMATTETQTARRQNYRAGFLNVLDRLEPPMPRNAAATLAAQVPLPPSPPPSVVGADERTFGTQTVQPVIEIAPPARRGNYRAGFYNILPNIVPPAELAAQARDIGMAQGFRQGRRRGEAIGALEGALQAVEALRFQQTTKARGTELFTVPELQQRFAEGGIIRAAGGRARAIEAAAEEAAPK